jgi:hypothetical protein
MRGQSFLPGAALSHHVVVGGGAFLGGVKPPGLDIRWSVDRLGTYVTESYMEQIFFYQGMLILCQSHHYAYVSILG